MTQVYGYNLLSGPDKALFTSHVRKLKSPANLFFNTELDYARQLKAQFPAMTVILRNWPDGDIHNRLTPSQWLNAYSSQVAGGITLATTNEPKLDASLVNWHLSLMKLCIPLRIPLCLLNLATGTWDLTDMPVLRPLLQLAGEHRDLFVLGLHSYAGGIITSGVRGGNPDNAGVIPTAPGGLDLTKRENWKQVKPTDTFFHIGRHKIILDYCTNQGIPPPRIGITETGFDFTGDIGSWLNQLGRETGFTSVNGWHTLKAQWGKWFPQWSPEMAYVEQFKFAADVLLKGVDFALFFAYGEDGSWGNYRVDQCAIPALLEANAGATDEHPKVEPPPVVTPPKPVDPPAPIELPPPPVPEPPETPARFAINDWVTIKAIPGAAAKAMPNSAWKIDKVIWANDHFEYRLTYLDVQGVLQTEWFGEDELNTTEESPDTTGKYDTIILLLRQMLVEFERLNAA